jgi:hypothetical protein
MGIKMMGEKKLFAVFSFMNYGLEKGSFYYLLYLFDESGPIKEQEISTLYKDYDPLEDQIGPFESLESLTNFLKKLAYYKNDELVFIYSPLEFNKVLEEITFANELIPTLIKNGRPIKAERPEKKRSILGIFE